MYVVCGSTRPLVGIVNYMGSSPGLDKKTPGRLGQRSRYGIEIVPLTIQIHRIDHLIAVCFDGSLEVFRLRFFLIGFEAIQLLTAWRRIEEKEILDPKLVHAVRRANFAHATDTTKHGGQFDRSAHLSPNFDATKSAISGIAMAIPHCSPVLAGLPMESDIVSAIVRRFV